MTWSRFVPFVLAAASVLCGVQLSACGDSDTPMASPCGGSGPACEGLTPEQKLRAEQITSVFENDTIELQYAYVEALDDGRGYTAGRAGFTSGTGDLLQVVETYTEAVPENGLAPFIPRLVELAEAESAAIDGLEGLPDAWAEAAADPRFREVQDDVVDELYYDPAVLRWQGAGLATPLALAALYDAIIQHGEGDDPDGLPAMMDRATTSADGDPASGVDESTWLTTFLEVRHETLMFAFNPETRDAWALGADRPEVFQQLLEHGVIVRPLEAYRMPSFLRVSVGTPAENDAFLAALDFVFPRSGS